MQPRRSFFPFPLLAFQAVAVVSCSSDSGLDEVSPDTPSSPSGGTTQEPASMGTGGAAVGGTPSGGTGGLGPATGGTTQQQDPAGTGGAGNSASGGGESTGGSSSSTGGGSNASGGGSSTGGGSNASGGGSSTGGSSNASDCSPDDATYESCANWNYTEFSPYYVRNNIWGADNPAAGSQCLWAASERCWGVDATHDDGNGWVKSYPQAVRGWVVGNGDIRDDHGLGISVTDLTKATAHWNMTAPQSGRYMALWDIYFHETAEPGGEKGSTVLMIFQKQWDNTKWLMNDSAQYDEIKIDGTTYRFRHAEHGDNAAQTIILWMGPFGETSLGQDSATFDLKAIIDDMRGRGHIEDTEYLTSIQIGWEIIEGGTFQTNDFWTAVQDEPDGG